MKPYIHYNPDIERGVLGICSLHHEAYSTVYHLLDDICFHERSNLVVFRAMRSLWQEGAPLDTLSIIARLYTDGHEQIDGVPAAFYVAELAEEKHLPVHLQHWCIQLRELAARRLMLQLTTSAYNGTDDVALTAQQLQEQIREALSIRSISKWVNARDAATRLADNLRMNPETVHGISTTIQDLDDINGGFLPGQLVIIGARPSVGKSALACGIALAAANAGHSTAFVSMEMTAHELYARMIAQEMNISYGDITRGRGGENPEVADKLAHLPLFFTDDPQLTVHDIRARAEQLQQNSGIHLLIVDYLQLIQEHADSKRPREQQISAISRGLKMIAMSLNIPVLALSQLNRESEHRQNKRPTLADLRESGAIEQDADAVMLLHRDWQAGIRTTDSGESTLHHADLLVCKWRNGRTTDLKLHFDGPTMRFW